LRSLGECLPSLSPLDEERFGFKTVKTHLINPPDVDKVCDFAKKNRASLCIVRCPTDQIQTVHELESRGFQLMDTLVYFRAQLRKMVAPENAHTRIRDLKNGEEDEIRKLSALCFQGYNSHYHSDPRLPKSKCDDVYTDWAYRLASLKTASAHTQVALLNQKIAGFSTMHVQKGEGEGILFGVAPFAQGQGLYRDLMLSCMQWCKSAGARTVVVSTQITNLAVQKIWTKLGFEPSDSVYTLHGWL
jgi:GNAT superfamily N-acetyltransferase